MANPIVIFNASSGSNTIASGAGPAVAITGTSAAHTNGVSTNIITLTNSPDLSGVTADGSAVLWMNTTSGRQYSKVTGVNNVAKTVTVEDTFNITSGSARNYAIGGKRATWSGDKIMFDAKPGWVIETETDQNGSLSPSVSGDLVNGPITFRGSEPYKRVNQTSSSPSINLDSNCVKLYFKNLRVVNSSQNTGNSGKSFCYGIHCTGTPEFVMENCIVGDPVDKVNHCLTAITSTDKPIATFIDCEFISAINSGTISQYGGEYRFIGCRSHGHSSTGISLSGSSTTGVDRLDVINCMISKNGGTGGINFRGLPRGGCITGCTVVDSTNNTWPGIDIGPEIKKVVIYNNNITHYPRGISSSSAVSEGGTFASGFVNYNNYFSVGIPHYQVSPGANDTALDPQYTNRDIFNYMVGPNLKAKGFPSSARTIGANQSGTASYVDIGAAQRRESINGIQPISPIALPAPPVGNLTNAHGNVPTLISGTTSGLSEIATPTGLMDTASKKLAQVFQVPKSGTIDSVLSLITVPVPSSTYKESFNKANSTTLGPDRAWTELDGDMEVFSNRCRFVNATGSRFPGFAVALINSVMPGQDMSVEVEMYSVISSSKIVEVIARGDSNLLNGYIGVRSGTIRAIRKVVGGTITSLTSSSVSAPADGTVLKLVVYGTKLELYEDGALVLSATDSSISTGQQVGIALEGSGTTVDNFSAAAAVGYGTSTSPGTPISTTTSQYTRTSGSFITDGFAVNNVVFVTGFNNAVNNGASMITALTATTMTVNRTLVTETGNGDEQIKLMAGFGGVLKVSLQDVSAGTGHPDGTIDQFKNINPTALVNGTMNTIGPLTNNGTPAGTKRTVTRGDILALVWEYQTFANGNQVNVGFLESTSHNFMGGPPYRDEHNGTTWAKKPRSCEIALQYSDGSYAVPPGSLGQSANAFTNSSSTIEHGLVFKVGKSIRLIGFWAFARIQTTSPNTLNVLLYDKNDNVLKTATLDSDFAETSNSNFYQSIFTSSQVLQAGEIYRLVIKPNSPSQVTFFTSTFSPTELRSESMPGITDWKTTQRTTGSAWTDSDNSKPLMGLLVDGVVGGDVKSPTIPVSGADSLDEGSTYSLTLGTPTSNTVTTYRVNWGDGSVNTYSSNGVKTHVYTDGKIILSITVDLIDESGVHIAAGGKTITVNNVAPTISLSGASSVARNTVYTLTLGAISDPGTDTVFEWRIDWGDGSSNTYFDGGAKTHTYTTAGSRTITVNLVDDDGLHHNPAPGTKVITVT